MACQTLRLQLHLLVYTVLVALAYASIEGHSLTRVLLLMQPGALRIAGEWPHLFEITTALVQFCNSLCPSSLCCVNYGPR